MEHTYYLLPLCVHVALPFLTLIAPTELKSILEAPLPEQMQQLHAFAWLLGPLVCCALGSYCLDSKNQFCFFPGTPYFHRVVQCNLMDTGVIRNEINSNNSNSSSGSGSGSSNSSADSSNHSTGSNGSASSNSSNNTGSSGSSKKSSSMVGQRHVSKAGDMELIRAWAMAHNPPETQSSHWWYTDLVGATRQAFDNVATSTQVESMFRELFSTKNYCVDVVTGMNEIYISGPARFDEAANSDNVFYTRHVDGPFGLLPFVSVYRCIVGLDHNEKVSESE